MSISSAKKEIAARMRRPQRHRLLQGFPPLPLMQPATRSASPLAVRRADGAVVDIGKQIPWMQADIQPEAADLAEPFLSIDKSRPLIIGIIPHTQCIPRTPACGFCTFPHDAPDKRQRASVIRSVKRDILNVIGSHPDVFEGRRVDAVYFGGGTANLAATSEIRKLFDSLNEFFDVAHSEVTLEGIPTLFSSWFHAHLRGLAELPARHKRISMGIQTFDPQQLERMGRGSFGNQKTIEGNVRHAHGLGFTASGDLLFALPGQTLQQMRDDVARAIDCGLDQICLYHLVLYAELGTPWSRNAELVGAMNGPEVIAEYWLDMREQLLRNGFVQTTLTNFERENIYRTKRRFIYEEASFNPDAYDVLGFGPLSISMTVDYTRNRGIKLLRRKRVGAFPWSGDDLYFSYESEDLKLLWLTRCLAGLSLDRARYRSRFGGDVAEHFPAAFDAAVESGLLRAGENAITLTPRGMFYSDSVIGTFAAERAAKLRQCAAGLSTQRVLEEPINLRSDTYSGMG